MKASKHIQQRLESLHELSRSSINISEIGGFFNFLAKENMPVEDFQRLYIAYNKEMENRRKETVERHVRQREPLPPFNFNEWVETIN